MICTSGTWAATRRSPAAIARHGLPISVVADDSSFPELFDLLRRQREGWGRQAHRLAQPPRDLRRAPPPRDPRPPRRLGLSQRRDPGPPVRRVDGAAGGPGDARGQDRLADPPVTIRRQPDDTLCSSRGASRSTSSRPTRPSSGGPPRPSPTGWPRSVRPPTSGTASSRSGRRPPRRPRTSSGGPCAMQAGQPDPGPGRGFAPPADATAVGSAPGVRGAPVSRSCRRARGRFLIGASWLACHLPEGPLVRLADLAGDLWYRAAPDRAAQARRNLRRVVTALAADGRGEPASRPRPPTHARWSGSSGPRSATTPATTSRWPGRRPSARARSTAAWPSRRPRSWTRPSAPGRRSSSSGSTSGRWRSPRSSSPSASAGAVAPMETIDDPALQAFFVRTRGAAGVRIVGLREARRELLTALRDGTAVGLVGDRDLTGGGVLMPLFGAPAKLPLGPAMLAVESGARPYVVGVRRMGVGRYSGRLERIDGPARRDAPRSRHGHHDRPCPRVRADRGDRSGAMVGGLLPDLARPRGGARR